jgi:hypothetical protein
MVVVDDLESFFSNHIVSSLEDTRRMAVVVAQLYPVLFLPVKSRVVLSASVTFLARR